ncbi:MAG: hypothetical protein E7586_05950 [Ruminococcaceae bacterium]|nr:hypothetical protein [Oscillospiraceae bacterium]
MKKLSLVLALILVLTCAVLAACGGDDTSSSAASSSASSSKVESSKPAASSKVESSVVESSDVESSEPEVSQPPVEQPKAPIAITGNVISTGCKYEVPGGEGYVISSGEWPSTYNAKLTDGVAATELAYDNTWSAFCSSGPDDDGETNVIDGKGTVIIDLGAAKKVSGVKTNIFLGSESGIVAPTAIVVSTSADGVTFSNPVSLTIPTTGLVGWAEGGFEAVDAQFVKVEYTVSTGGVFTFLNEVEVYGA